MINDRDMPTWRFITLKKKLGAAIYIYIYILKWYFYEYPKARKKTCEKNIFIFYLQPEHATPKPKVEGYVFRSQSRIYKALR
jgi:hypothetical protein